MTLKFLVIIGFAFGLFAALMAFLITYGEYSRHFMAKTRALKISLETASVIFVLFFAIAIVAGFVLSRS
jgi:hypothetical protein